MKHEIDIWSKLKETGKNFLIEAHIVITQEQIEEFAAKIYKKNHDLRHDREYWAEIDKTIH